MQPNKQEAKGHVRLSETGAGEQSAAVDENSRHDHGLQNRHSCMVRLPYIYRESRENQQYDKGDERGSYGFRDERFFHLRLYAVNDCCTTPNVG